MHKYRTHNCAELTKENIGQNIKLAGFVHSKRDHGGLIFIDLRDHYGVTQMVIDKSEPPKIIFDENVREIFSREPDKFEDVIIDPENKEDINSSKPVHETASTSEGGKNALKRHSDLGNISKIKLESVLVIEGEVIARDAEMINDKIPTGEIEIKVAKLEIESLAQQIPFQINDNNDYPEDLRLKYRFLDLRREKTHKNIKLRSQVISHIRAAMTNKEFLEIQTPILTASSPEGARDYLVPSRLHHGKFYALPQAPQQFKQLLMVSNFDRYFQIAPCFRDEDLRADRAPEFYQLDMEMAYATQEDIFEVIEPVLKDVFEKFGVKKVLNEDFVKIPYGEAMLKYGSDKPDLRNPIEISEGSDIFVGSGFSIFTKALDSGSVIRSIPAPKTANKPRSFFDKTIAHAQEHGAKGLAYIIFDENGVAKGPIAKFLSEDKLNQLKKDAGLENGDSVFFSCGNKKEAAKIAGVVRDKLGSSLNLIDESVYKFCWIIDFPMYELNEQGKIDFSHNPFSMPQGGIEVLNGDNPLEIKAYQYDIVCNGIELSSGAIRNHKPEIMYKAFEIAGYGKETVEKEFGAMVGAFKYGAPPHGGIAPGIDRIIMLLADEPNIREVIPFPMNGKAQDLMMDAPAQVGDRALKEVGISLKGKKA